MTNERRMAVLALLLVIGGVVVPTMVMAIGMLFGLNWTMVGYATLYVVELTAIVLGLMSKEKLGQVSAGVADVIVVASLRSISLPRKIKSPRVTRVLAGDYVYAMHGPSMLGRFPGSLSRIIRVTQPSSPPAPPPSKP